jgi:hypothetical protein
MDIDKLYQELGVVTYNIELYQAILQQLENSKLELLKKIRDIEESKED